MAAYEDISYTLTDAEVIAGLKSSKYTKSTGKRALVESLILAGLAVFFLISFIMKQRVTDFVFTIVSIAVLILLNALPYLDRRKRAASGEKTLKLRLYPDCIYIYGEKGTTKLRLTADTKIRVAKKDEVVSIRMENDGVLVIPIRALPKERRNKILAQWTKDE